MNEATDTIRQNAWLEFIAHLPPQAKQAATLLQHWVMDTIDYRRDAGDHWQAPQETLATGQGDCEDFAILWYASLRLYGLEPNQVRLAYITTARGPHMVCLAKLPDTTLVLDNLREQPTTWEAIENQVVYMINEQGLWIGDELRSTIASQWDRVLAQLSELDGMFAIDMSGA